MEESLQLLHLAVQIFCVVGILWVGSQIVGFLKTLYVYFLRPGSNIKKYGSWAIVTGCTDGIGKAITDEFASKGLNMILISRSQSKLDSQAKELLSKFKVEVKTLAIDFSADNSIYDKISTAIKDLDVGILVNNVGIDSDPEYFHSLDRQTIESIIRVNVYSTTYMTYLVLPGMLERKRGAIINVSSLSGYLNEPLHALYSATKAFMNSFSKALHYEYREKGIHVQCQIPGIVKTKLAAGVRYPEVYSSSSFSICNAAKYAKEFVKHIGYDNTIITYWGHAIEYAQASRMPESVVSNVVMTQSLKLRERLHLKSN